MTFDIWGMRDMHFAQAPIEKQVTDAFELVKLESWLDDELACESNHDVTGKSACSVTVTHRYHVECKSKALLICEVSATTALNRAGWYHVDCSRSDCITVVPI